MKDPAADILTLENLGIGYSKGRGGKQLLPPLNAHAGKGELIAVIGRNGIGKSTLLRTIAGIQKPIHGGIRYNGAYGKEFSRNELARTIGFISTEIVRVANMRVVDLVALGRYPYTDWIGRIEKDDLDLIWGAIAKTGMTKLSGRFVSELSDGERQKAMIARLIAQDTGIMVMDEPTAFLDIGSKFEILHLMHRLSVENGKTIIFSTHDLSIALSQADKIWLILEDGMLEGAPEDLLLRGAFGHLFDSDVVHYNPENGTYAFRTENRGRINVAGEGIIYHYTRKALNRAGYTVVKGEAASFLLVPDCTGNKWQFINESGKDEFESLYEFLTWLRKKEGKIT